jgi:hypothetical protein
LVNPEEAKKSPVKLTNTELNSMHVVGRLDNGLFVVKLHSDLYVVDQLKVKESHIYQKLYNEYELPRKPMPNHLRLDESKLGFECWAIAMSNNEEYLWFTTYNDNSKTISKDYMCKWI